MKDEINRLRAKCKIQEAESLKKDRAIEELQSFDKSQKSNKD